jgi:hypothetical protein
MRPQKKQLSAMRGLRSKSFAWPARTTGAGVEAPRSIAFEALRRGAAHNAGRSAPGKRTRAVLDAQPRNGTFDWLDKVSIELTTRMLPTSHGCQAASLL